jgi:hypothetical protein
MTNGPARHRKESGFQDKQKDHILAVFLHHISPVATTIDGTEWLSPPAR